MAALRNLHGVFSVWKPAGSDLPTFLSRFSEAILTSAGCNFRFVNGLRLGHSSGLPQQAEGIVVCGVGHGCRALKDFDANLASSSVVIVPFRVSAEKSPSSIASNDGESFPDLGGLKYIRFSAQTTDNITRYAYIFNFLVLRTPGKSFISSAFFELKNFWKQIRENKILMIYNEIFFKPTYGKKSFEIQGNWSVKSFCSRNWKWRQLVWILRRFWMILIS